MEEDSFEHIVGWSQTLSHRGGSSLLTSVSLGQEFPLVDRREELGLLKTLFEKSLQGNGQVVFVAGEGGVGKTRLVQELGHYSQERGAIFVIGRSYEEEAVIPYSPWVEIIRSLTRQDSDPRLDKAMTRTLAMVARIVPEVAVEGKELGLKGWLSGSERADLVAGSEVDRTRLFQAVTDFLTHASNQRPIVLFLDDILWADAASLQLLHYFCRRIRDQKILLVATYRDVELAKQHPLARLLLDLNRDRVLRQISLNRLTSDYVAEIISNHLGGGDVLPEFAKLVYTRTGGNPFFVEEVIRLLADESRIYRSERGWTLKEIGKVEIPSTVRALIEHRVSRLGVDLVQTLSSGSAMGMDFPYELLKKVTGQEDEALIAQLEKAAQAGLLIEKRVGRDVFFAFPDEQIRDYFYSELSLIRKRKTHGRIAQATEELYQTQKDEHLEELAYHYIQAGELAKAAEFSLKAGNRAAELHAYPEAKKHYQNVLELLDEQEKSERLEILIKLGDASAQTGESKDAIDEYTEALSLSTRLKQNPKTVEIYSDLGHVAWYNESDKQSAISYFREGLKASKQGEETSERAAILQDAGRLLIITREPEEGHAMCEEALRIARKVGAFPVQSHAIQSLALGLKRDREHKDEILKYLEEALKLALDHELVDPASRAFHNLGCQYAFVRANYAKAEEILERGAEYARKNFALNYEAIIEAELATYAYLPIGKWGKAIESANHSYRVASEYGFKVGFSKSLMALGIVDLFHGNLDRAEEYLNQAHPLTQNIRITEWTYLCDWALGKLHLEKRQFEKAENYLLSAAEVGLHGAYISTHESLFELVKLYLSTGNSVKTDETYQKLRYAAEELDEPWAYAYERWAGGLVAKAKADLKGAAEALQQSNELWTKLGHRYNTALTNLELGRIFHESGDQKKSAIHFDKAKTVFTELGAKADLRKLPTQI
jgi:tetratricopeptide (TPR) repeat protein